MSWCESRMLTRVVVVLLTCVWSSDSWMEPSMSSYGLCLYGNSVECCWGWRPAERGRCQPRCQQGCKHGECVAPDRCKCHPGYTGKACNHDLNECGMKPRPCKHRCMNTPGSYKCYCQDGYTMQPDGSCRNARTCFHANCQYGCEVMKGVVRCTCPSPGLRLGPDRRTCVDIDECVSGGGVCPHRRKCVNTFGSFMCKCHRGFRLMYINGRYNCIDKDTRPFCSLNPSSPKCRCRDGSCAAVFRVTVEQQTPRTTMPNTPDYTAGSTVTTVTSVPTTAVTTVTVVTAVQFSISATLSTTAATTTIGSVTTSESRLEASATATPTTAGAAPVTTTTTTTTSPTTAPSPSASPTPPPPAPPFTDKTLTTVALSSVSPAATTVNNRIYTEVTHRQRGDVHIPRRPGDNHVWDFDVELGETADSAADDPGGAVLECTFDQGLCGWMSDGDGDLQWEISISPAGGRYLSMPRLKSGQGSVRGARLSVPIVPPWKHGDLCFSFSHWLTGYQVGTLQLFALKRGREGRNSPALWSRTGGHGWRHTQVTLMANSVDRVLLKADRRTGQRGQIAIDDVTLRQGVCL